MRKVHYRVILDVLAYEDDDAEEGATAELITESLQCQQGDSVDIRDMSVVECSCTDSR